MFTHRPTFAHIDLDALVHNFNVISDRLGDGLSIMAVVKADAYGHGGAPIAAVLERIGAATFGVAFCEEGIRLREGGVTKPILVLGGIYFGEAKKAAYYNLTPVIISRQNALDTIQQFKDVGLKTKVHIKVDSGMNRIGLHPDEVDEVVDIILKSKVLEINGLMSHLATVTPDLGEYYWKQVTIFREIVDRLEKRGVCPPWVHIANSSAVIAAPRPPFNLVRVGVSMFGASPGPTFSKMLKVKPVLELITEIIHVKSVPPGNPISYEGTFVTKADTVVATIPMGYADGLNRKLSNRGEALVRGRRVPIIGNVCMDMSMLDVTAVPGAAPGDKVTLIGTQGDEIITADEVARHCGTIPYEILTNINHRVARIYRKGDSNAS